MLIWIYGQVANITLKFKAISAGQATITTNLDISDASANSMGGSTSATITINKIEDPKPEPSDTENTTDPNTNTNTTEPEEPSAKEPTFKNVKDTVYAIKKVNIRSSYSTSSKSLGKLNQGESIQRTGIGDNGWDRVIYNGQICYISSSYLTTEKPKEEEKIENKVAENKITGNTTITNEENNVVQNETNIIANEIINELSEEEKIANEIGKLPEVGTTYAEYFLIICIVLSIIGLLITNYKINKKE